MKRYIKSSETTLKHKSACSFDADLGPDYNQRKLEEDIIEIFNDLGLEAIGIDFRSVEYPQDDATYTQIGVDFEYEDTYYEQEIEDELYQLIETQGDFLGIDFYSIDQ